MKKKLEYHPQGDGSEMFMFANWQSVSWQLKLQRSLFKFVSVI